jgi:hypothetical protein
MITTSSTFHWPTITRIVGGIVVPLWVAPALYYNLDWAGEGVSAHNLTAIVFIIAAALCFLGLHWLSDPMLRRLALVLGLGLTCNNSWNALENIANVDNLKIDGRRAKIDEFSRRSSDRRGWSETVERAKLQVQDVPVATLEAELDAYLLQNAGKWRSSRECAPGQTTSSAAFCIEVARLKGRIALAKDRDEKAGWVRDLDAELRGEMKPTHADNMAATVGMMLATFGVTPTPAGVEGIRAWRIATKVFWLEAQAAFMPSIWIGIVEVLIAAIAAAARLKAAAARMASRKGREVDAPAAPDQPVEAAPPAEAPKPAKSKRSKLTPEYQPFFVDELETGSPTYTVRPTPLHDHFASWCKNRKLAVLSQRALGEIMTELGPAAGWARDQNNGYPTYRGVRLRPKLRVVSNNG